MEHGKDNAKSNLVVALIGDPERPQLLESFMAQAPVDRGICYLLLHNEQGDEDFNVTKLAALTPLEVQEAKHDVYARPDNVYLVPSPLELYINRNSKMILNQRDHLSKEHCIDRFLLSFADQFGTQAAVVFLTTRFHCGFKGASAIKQKDGLVLVQNDSIREDASSATSSVAQDNSNYMLASQDIPSILIAHANKVREQNLGTADSFALKYSKEIDEILSLLVTVDDIDFAQYRKSTFLRRLERRIKLNDLDNVAQYLGYIKENREELHELHNELFIGVTEFFRDAECFDYIEKCIVPEIVRHKSTDPIRIWVSGCSTGEEAYSFAILFFEYFAKKNVDRTVKIFATDVDRESLSIASSGIYKASSLKNIPTTLLRKYFDETDQGFVIKSFVRKAITFAHHNVVKDPPFTKLDLVSCRNLLIYFQESLQLKALSMFHFGLNDQGLLLLGKSESLGDLAEEFETVNTNYKMFRKKRNVRLALHELNLGQSNEMTQKTVFRAPNLYVASQPGDLRLTQVYEKLLNEFVPAGLIIDDDLQILHVFGQAQELLEVGIGKISYDLSRLLPKELAIAISGATSQVSKTQKPITFNNITASIRNERKVFNISIRPAAYLSNKSVGLYLVFFEDSRVKRPTIAAPDEENFKLSDQVTERIDQLEEQLRITRETLQATIEELETTNEELQSTNEELMSSNEELQSANEELHAVNEELFSVNSEYQNKIGELIEANNDIDLLVKTSKMGILFLCPKLTIRRFTPGMSGVINLRAHDLGRSITDLTFRYDHDSIVDLIETVSRTGKPSSLEISRVDTTYLVSAIAHRSSKDNFQKEFRHAVVVSFLDISTLKEAEELRRTAEDLEQFTYVVSHDLQKPINRLSLELSEMFESLAIRKVDISDNQNRIEYNINLLTSMLDVLLEYSRIRTRGAPFEPCHTEEVILEAARIVGLPKSQLTMASLPNVFGDRTQLIHLFRLLLENSIKHCGKKDGLQVQIKAHQELGKVVFHVSDNGPGIPRSAVSDVFKIFNQMHAMMPLKLSSGLAFAKRIVQRHHGEIEIVGLSSFSTWSIKFSLPFDQNN